LPEGLWKRCVFVKAARDDRMSSDKRRRSRVNAHFNAVVYIDDEKIPVQTLNISMKGVLCSPDPRLVEGKECRVVFTLAKNIKFRVQAKIIRTRVAGVAIDFESMDETAFFHLRNIVRYSAEDADMIDRELNNPAFSPDEGE